MPLEGLKLLASTRQSQYVEEVSAASVGVKQVGTGIDDYDLLADFYINWLSCSLVESHTRDRDINSEQKLPQQSAEARLNKVSQLDQESLKRLNDELGRYYKAINGVFPLHRVEQDDELSKAYLDSTENKWPLAKDLIIGYPELSNVLEALSKREELCKNIIAAQHCRILAMCNTKRDALNSTSDATHPE